MTTLPTSRHLLAISFALLAAAAGPAGAQAQTAGGASSSNATRDSGEVADAIDSVNKAVQVVHQMSADPTMAALLKRAKGVYVVPEYGRGALIVGGRGGAGVLLVKHGNTWSNPAFYNMGGISIGAQAGGEGGAIAFVLNDQKAMHSFMQANKFSLNADAGLTVIDWSKKGTGAAGWGDVTVWSNTKGLFGGAAISVTDVHFDADKNAAYYNRRVAARDVLSGKVSNPQAATLKQALASASTSGSASMTGSSGAGGNTSSSGTMNQQNERQH
jgi:SH3 domain-containing YSC84-like protein 1